MSKGVIETVLGAAEIAAGIVLDVTGIGAALGNFLIASGVGMVAGGIGTLLTQQQVGLSASVRNPIQPWNIVYGQAKIGGTVVFIEETGSSDKYLHLVYVLAAHTCKSIDAVLFDGKRVCLDTSGNSISFGDSTPIIGNQQTVNIASITRANGVVTITLVSPIGLPASTAAGPAIMDGDTLFVQNISTDQSLNGEYQIQVIDATHVAYTNGGANITISGQGSVVTRWPDYGDTVHTETALGTQTSNPFPGLVAGGDSGSQGLWTAAHALQGRTAIYLRLKYGGNTYASGLPTIAFLISGKNDILDPRTGTNGYTTNAALCIADFLSNQTWGFKCQYGTDIPTAPLWAAANICDEMVPLAIGGTESRYTCNGSFQVSAKRGEILQNLLTSCAGRLSYASGEFIIYPGAWIGPGYWLGVAANTGILSVVSNYTTSGGNGPEVRLSTLGSFFPDAGGTVFGQAWFQTYSGYSQQTNSTALSQAQVGALGSLTLYAEVWNSLLWTGNATLNIYDVYIDITNPDGTTTRYRPTSNTVLPGDGSGTIVNAANAYDASLSTYATITRTSSSSLAVGPTLELSGWSNIPPPTTPGPTITDVLPLQYAAGPFQWKPKLPTRDLYNGVKATYVSPLNSWQAADMPPYAQDTDHGYSAPAGTTGYYDINLATDGGDRRWYDMQLPFTISVSTAQRIAKIELLRRRMQGAGTFVFNLYAYQFTVLDIVAFTLPFLGWTNKLLEVTAHRFTVNKKDDNAMTLGTELDLQETDPSIYTWSTAEDLSPEGFQQASTNNVRTVQAVAGLTAVNSTVVGTGISTNQVQVSWTAPTDGYVIDGGQTIVQYSLDDTNWIGLGTFDSSVTSAFIPNVSAGQTYWVRVAFVNTAGIQGAWTVYGPLTASGSTLRRIDDETPSGTINGTNTSFTLSQTANPAASLSLYLNGDLQLQGLDYTISGAAITMTTAPLVGEWLRAFYWY